LTKEQFKKSPVADPSGDPLERGMDVMKQLEYYEEFLARHNAVIGSKFQGTTADVVSGGRKSSKVGTYYGPDPVVEKNLYGILRHYLDYRNDEHKPENPKEKGHDLKKFLPDDFGGHATTIKRFNGYKEPRYYIQTPYDLYGFHQGFASGDDLFSTQKHNVDPNKHTISHTMTARTFDMVRAGEHIARYMKAVGMTSIDWTKVGVAGMGNYVDKEGKIKAAFPNKPIDYYNENADDIKRIQKAYMNRKNLIKKIT